MPVQPVVSFSLQIRLCCRHSATSLSYFAQAIPVWFRPHRLPWCQFPGPQPWRVAHLVLRRRRGCGAPSASGRQYTVACNRLFFMIPARPRPAPHNPPADPGRIDGDDAGGCSCCLRAFIRTSDPPPVVTRAGNADRAGWPV